MKSYFFRWLFMFASFCVLLATRASLKKHPNLPRFARDTEWTADDAITHINHEAVSSAVPEMKSRKSLFNEKRFMADHDTNWSSSSVESHKQTPWGLCLPTRGRHNGWSLVHEIELKDKFNCLIRNPWSGF
jgi:hypothetical protein